MQDAGLFTASLICASARSLATGAVERQMQRQPEVAEYGEGATTLLADTEVRLGYLAEAIAADRPALFNEQIGWVKVLCAARGVPLAILRGNLECMGEELVDRLPDAQGRQAAAIIEDGLAYFEAAPTEIPSYLEAEAPHIDLARRFLLAVLEGRGSDAVELIVNAAAAGVDRHQLQEYVLRKVQYEVGRMWQMAEVSIAEEHFCSGVVSNATTLLRSQGGRSQPNGRRVIAASVNSESHDIGIRAVTLELDMQGWDVLYLGAGTPAVAITDAVRDFGCDLIALSASIMLYVRQTADMIAAVRRDPLGEDIPILVGGHPFNVVDDLWKVVGADGCSGNAAEASDLAARLVGV